MAVTEPVTARFWPVQRQDYRTVYDAETRMDIAHARAWAVGAAEEVAASLNATPSHVVCWNWTGADVWTDPADQVPFELCVLSGGHFFGEGATCSGCGFRPKEIAR